MDISAFARFVLEHENDDTTKLLLAGNAPEGTDIRLVVSNIEARRKIRRKIPSWYSVPSLVFPSRLSCEQSSSEQTALYKAKLLRRLCGDRPYAAADLNGGLGVDSWAFSKYASSVLYNEMNSDLAATVSCNFRSLGCGFISVSSFRLVPSGSCPADDGMCDGKEKCNETADRTVSGILGSFVPDVIYLDPARRSVTGKKVFLLEDCSPDVLALKDELLSASPLLLLKLSPMADIGMLLSRLGRECCEVHVISYAGECREVVIVMKRGYSGSCTLFTVEDDCILSFSMEEIHSAEPSLLAGREEMKPGMILFEPGKSIMKAGAANAFGRRHGLSKLGIFSHYFLIPEDGAVPEEVMNSGKLFRISEVAELNNRNVRDAGKRYPRAEVTARNIKTDTESLRKKLGVVSGDDVHIFGMKCDFRTSSGNYLIIGKPVRRNPGG